MTLRYPSHKISTMERYVAESAITVSGSATTIIPLTDRTYVRLSLADDGTMDLEAGSEDGQYRIIIIDSLTSTSTQKLENSSTVQLIDRAWLPESAGEMLGLIWNATNSKWFEKFRSINYDSIVGIYVKNMSGATITRGKAVYISGADGNNPLISLADNSSELTSERTIGLVHDDIANNAFGHVITSGLVENVVTTGFTSGDTLYLGTSGNFTTVQPQAPAQIVKVGSVIRVGGATVGSVQVWISNGWELNELHDVQINSVAKGDIVARNNSNLWVNVPVGTNTHVLTADSTTATGVKWATPDPWTYVVLGTDFTTTSSSSVNVTNLFFTPAINSRYEIYGHLLLRTATATVGARPGVNPITVGVLDNAYYIDAPNSTTTLAIRTEGATTANLNAASTGLPTTTNTYLSTLIGTLITNGSATGNYQITLASETAGTTVTMRAGSFIKYRTY